MKKINIGVVGGSGKMGKALKTSFDRQTVTLFLTVSRQYDADFHFSVESINHIEPEILSQVDVWIDFSSDKGLRDLVFHLKKYKTPIVSGTTGLSESTLKNLKVYSKSAAVFWASNMSVGLWTMRQALKSLRYVSDFDFEIIETHHIHKKDNPSGTAKTLRSDLENILSKKIKIPYGKRQGGVYGVHEITGASSSELLKIEHTALNREVFAQGALRAAQWLIKQKPGLYSMDDMMLKMRRK